MIYLDYMSTTPVDPRVIAVMQNCLQNDFGNPSSQHALGFQAREKIAIARDQVANLIHADSKEIIWTSGATESINLALKGVAQFYQRQGKHIITMSTEHKAVLDTCRYLESQGFSVSYLNPEKNGILDLQQLRDAIRPDTILCSIMHVNNETGVIQDIAAIGKILRERGVWFHVDAAQSAGKLPIDLKNLPVDLMSLASHKIYGPKGIGALYVRRQPRVQLIPQMHGGDADNYLRAGTLPTHQIVGMGEAYRIAEQGSGIEDRGLVQGSEIGDRGSVSAKGSESASDHAVRIHSELNGSESASDRATQAHSILSEAERIKNLRDQLWKNLSIIPGISLNGDLINRIGNCLNISINHINTEQFLKTIPDIAISTGSACNSVDPEPSHVLIAMGLSRDLANRSFRISLGRFTTEKEIELASAKIISAIPI